MLKLGEIEPMDINKMLAELRQEREQIEEAIMTLERLARGRGRRRGRPPAWMAQIKKRGRPPGRRRLAEQQSNPRTRLSFRFEGRVFVPVRTRASLGFGLLRYL